MKNLNKEQQNYFNRFGYLDILNELETDIWIAFQTSDKSIDKQKIFNDFKKEYNDYQNDIIILENKKDADNYIQKLENILQNLSL